MTPSSTATSSNRSDAALARTQIKSAKFKPLVERPHSSIDHDKTRTAVGTRVRAGPTPISDAQRRKLKRVYMLHVYEMHAWFEQRQIQVYHSRTGGVKAKWNPPWPHVPWQEVCHGYSYGIHLSVDVVQDWMAREGKALRKNIRAGRYPDFPEWTVRCLHVL